MFAPTVLLFASACAALTTGLSPRSQLYSLKTTYMGHGFLDGFSWETMDDPTHGRVNFVDQGTALGKNLTWSSDSQFVMRADHTNSVHGSDRGRDSVRIQSHDAYDQAVFVLDLAHMPAGCATWPAFWTISQEGPWPLGGEIDIIENVNDADENLSSLHTTGSCSMPQERSQGGETVSTDCDASVNTNQGCGTTTKKSNSFGTGFNVAGGGHYVLQKSDTGIRTWFFPRDDQRFPAELAYGAQTVHPGPDWGTPDAFFPMGGNCDYGQHFNAHAIVFDLTLCGDWAGSAWGKSSCAAKASSCQDYVDNNPEAFAEAYWDINSLRVYTLS
ncbi:glycoside hydrolase family 16 protein [Coniophora puteana RWD-64-598 SS2]|uniref:Glycoside hydrolase family 16 protein n=1 Tax=Coniophora puteana (strain RWD-64-598) TaxID=741705 RepID=A0A5M3MWV5_CONPW|nr:glycoside hydrolase family 16 protein [Coniophora puteana RWD-64-598 SS2]EIW83244.1 glycoside hydrolase family 16 protein [Coniophora puteana RWD-64-598 SS2]